MAIREADFKKKTHRLRDAVDTLEKELRASQELQQGLRETISILRDLTNSLPQMDRKLAERMTNYLLALGSEILSLPNRLRGLENSIPLAEELEKMVNKMIANLKGTQELDDDVPVGDILELSKSTIAGINRGIAEIENGQVVGPMPAQEFIKRLEKIAKR